MERWRANLPSNVETDSEAPRVPPLDPHKFVDSVDGCAVMEGTRFDSGIGDSFKSDSLLSGDVAQLMDTHSQITSKFGSISLSDRQQSDSEQSQNRTDPPQTRFDSSDNKTDSLYDEGFISGAGLQSVDSVHSETSISQCTEQSSQHSEDQTSLQQRKQRELESIFEQDEDGDTQLHIAIIQSVDVMALHMISVTPHPELLNISNSLQQSPLHLAVVTKQPGIVRHLVARGAALDARDRHGNTPLHLACRDGSLECVKALTMPFSPEERYSQPITAMQRLPQDGTIKNYDGETCLHIAAANYHMPVIGHLVNQVGYDINMRDGRSGRTVLHYAIDMDRVDLVVLLLHYRCDVNTRTFDSTTPLQLAAGRGLEHAVDMLIKNGADYEQLNFEGISDVSSDEDEDMMDLGREAPFYDDFAIGGQPISSI